MKNVDRFLQTYSRTTECGLGTYDHLNERIHLMNENPVKLGKVRQYGTMKGSCKGKQSSETPAANHSRASESQVEADGDDWLKSTSASITDLLLKHTRHKQQLPVCDNGNKLFPGDTEGTRDAPSSRPT